MSCSNVVNNVLKKNTNVVNNVLKKNADVVYSSTSSILKNITSNTEKKDAFYKDLIEQMDLLENKDSSDKENYIKSLFYNPLLDVNNSKYFNNIWKYNSSYFLDYNEKILNPVVEHMYKKNDNSLIDMFLKNGLIYVDKIILCVNPSKYSHSAIIVKFNKPIKFDDSSSDVAGILYSYSIKGKANNSKISFWDKIIKTLKQLLSFFWNQKAYMTRIMLTSDDFREIEKHPGDDVFNLSNVDGNLVRNSVNMTFSSIETLNKLPKKQNIYLKNLTSNIEQISYFFSLYSKNTKNHISEDKIKNYSFSNNNVSLEIDCNSDGNSIYDFIRTDCKTLNLSEKEKLSVIKKFLKLECIKLLTENNIIDKNATEFSIDDFYKLPNVTPSDLKRKFCYPKTLPFDLKNDSIDEAEAASTGNKIIKGLEELNRTPRNYSFLYNNCLTVIKEILFDCGNNELKTLLENTDKKSSWVGKRHPELYFDKLSEEINLKKHKIDHTKTKL